MMVKRKLDGALDKSLADRDFFVNPARLYITSERSGGLHQVESGLTADRQAVRQASSLADKIWARLEILKLAVNRNIRFSALFSQGTAFFSNFDALLMLFQANTATKLFYGV